LLVAVVLIATVIITYSAIRSSPVSDIPQVLSAIDETNFALKQVLGFTIGYYGSVLQVTGNTTYAKILAENYLYSGLANIANMHPDWGVSFNVETMDLQARWFERTSYSMGNLKVSYNLTGLGIYGISYEVTCKSNINVIGAVDNKAVLNITKDENEPLLNLGKSNFKFYKYNYDKLSWELVSPTNEPEVTSKGTYFINLPPGVDPDYFMVQVEDPRGIKVIASSFNRYSFSVKWNPESVETKYAVIGDSNLIIGPPDGAYATITKNSNCQVSKYQNGTGIIKQVFFKIIYYGSGNGELRWLCQLPNGTWYDMGALEQGGSATSPKIASFNATALWPQWTWSDLNKTVIQFRNMLNTNAYVDAIYITVLIEKELYSYLRDATVVVELLQNGTLRWLGQNLKVTTKVKPIPPIPIKSIHVNQTINGVNCEVPFQIEDWVSDYRIPLGLASNMSVFNNRHMLVFLINPNVSKITIWWNGEDKAVQTPLAYTNKYFRYRFVNDTIPITISNGILNLTIDFSRLDNVNSFKVISRVNTFSVTAVFMRINNRTAHYGHSKPMYSVLNGPVRAILHHEVEWPDGIPNCPNVYAHIVLALPANATYYTYQLRLIFMPSTYPSRNIWDLCPIKITKTSTGTLSTLTENGVATDGYPIVSITPGTFYNASNVWQHHWSQLNSSLTRGFGIMFPDDSNVKLYYFDPFVGDKTGCLSVLVSSSSKTIEFSPVKRFQVSNFASSLDICWHGAVVTFDSTTPIYYVVNGVPSGLWVLVEYPPIISVATEG